MFRATAACGQMARLMGLSAFVGGTAAMYVRPRTLHCDYSPVNTQHAPSHLRIGNSSFNLVSAGTRKVTFLGISVYDIGLYIDSGDIAVVNASLRSLQIDSPEALKAQLMDPVKGAEFIESLSNVSFAVRITPVRNTDIAHLRDGFLRGITARHDPDEEILQEFKEFFPNPRKAFNKGQVMLLTCHKGRSLALDIDGHDYGTFQAKGPPAMRLLQAFIGTYVSGQKVACEPLRREFVDQIVTDAF